jgi:hypothetical protein
MARLGAAAAAADAWLQTAVAAVSAANSAAAKARDEYDAQRKPGLIPLLSNPEVEAPEAVETRVRSAMLRHLHNSNFHADTVVSDAPLCRHDAASESAGEEVTGTTVVLMAAISGQGILSYIPGGATMLVPWEEVRVTRADVLKAYAAQQAALTAGAYKVVWEQARAARAAAFAAYQEAKQAAKEAHEVGRCRLTVTNPVFKAPTVLALETVK